MRSIPPRPSPSSSPHRRPRSRPTSFAACSTRPGPGSLPPHRRRLRRLHLGHHDPAGLQGAVRQWLAAGGHQEHVPRYRGLRVARHGEAGPRDVDGHRGRPEHPLLRHRRQGSPRRPAGIRGHGGRLRRSDPDLHPGGRADPGARRRRAPGEPGPVQPHLRPHRERGQAEAEQGPGAAQGLAGQAQGDQGRIPGDRRGRRDHRPDRLDRRRACPTGSRAG